MADTSIDPFAPARERDGVLIGDFSGETIPMILRHGDVRRAARDWGTFSSDAPMRVPIPSEEGVRSVRQLPIEADPPLHTRFRKLLNPLFLRPLAPGYQAQIDALIGELIDRWVAVGPIEIVRDFALPLQSRALARLLGMPDAAAEEWIGWGTHVFHDGEDSSAKGQVLDRYIRHALTEAQAREGDDFFVFLNTAQVDGRPLTEDEKVGVANLTFAGGRDTVINTVSRMIAHFAAHRADLNAAAADARSLAHAVEEFVRFISPLTHIGRVCPVETEVHGHRVAAGGRVSLGWAAANHDPAVFDDPGCLRLDRSPNPHLGFGSGIHTCLGAAQARTILRSLIRQLATRTATITVIEEHRHHEDQASYRRWVGHDRLVAQATGRT